jgi:hypothetical protein
MPILSKLQKNLGEMKEVNELAEWADSLLEGGDGGEASEEEDVLTPGDAGEGGAEDAPADNLSEAPGAETLAHNEKTVKGNLDAFDLDEDESLTSNNPIGIPEEEVDESALQAYLGNKKYGKDGMRKLQQLGREHASKATVAKAKAEYASEDVAEDLDANQKRVGQLGPTEKVKNNNIGKLVGANENFINTDAQAVVTEVDTGEYDARKSNSKGETTPQQEKEFRKKVQAYGKELEQRQKEKVKEGQDDLNAIKRLLGK